MHGTARAIPGARCGVTAGGAPVGFAGGTEDSSGGLHLRHSLGDVSAQDQTPPVRVLVVDDSEVFLNVLADVAAATSGFEVVGRAASGREALHLVEDLAPDLVLMDVQMPDLDGVETGLRIRRHYPQTVVLLLTASKQELLADPSLTVEQKRDLTSTWLAEFWQEHGHSR